MNVISSLGGPLIGLPSKVARLWGGTNRKEFFSSDSSFLNDYEAAGFLTDGRHYPPCDIAIIHGAFVDGILLTMPVETCILSSTSSFVQIAQIHYADQDWSFDDIDLSLFESISFDESLKFESCGGDYIIFDSAFSGDEIETSLTFDLIKGDYTFSSALVKKERCLFSLTQLRV